MKPTIKNLIFDLGNVLVEWDLEKIISQIEKNPERQKALYQDIFESGIWEEQDKGNLDILGAVDLVKKRMDDSYHDAVEEVFFRWFHHTLSNVELQNYAIELKKRGYQIFILSNTSPIYYDIVDSGRLPISAVLSGKVLSFEEYLMKPDIRIFKILCERYRLKPDECVYVDDLLKNVEAAKSLGMIGIQCRDFQQVIDDLKLLLEN